MTIPMPTPPIPKPSPFYFIIYQFQNNFSFNFRIPEPPSDGVYIYGLFIEGARWCTNEKSLCEQLPKVIINDFPCIHFLVCV